MSLGYAMLLGWYVLGLAGCWIACYTDHKKGEDFKLLDCFLVLFAMNFGVILFVIGVHHYFKNNKPYNPVLIRGSRNLR